MHSVLKTLVIGMGALIALGLGLLVYGFYMTSQDPNWRLFSQSTAPARLAVGQAQVPMALTGNIDLGLPTGCAITDIKAAGGLLYILTGPPSGPADSPGGGCGQVLVVDPSQGRITGRLAP